MSFEPRIDRRPLTTAEERQNNTSPSPVETLKNAGGKPSHRAAPTHPPITEKTRHNLALFTISFPLKSYTLFVSAEMDGSNEHAKRGAKSARLACATAFDSSSCSCTFLFLHSALFLLFPSSIRPGGMRLIMKLLFDTGFNRSRVVYVTLLSGSAIKATHVHSESRLEMDAKAPGTQSVKDREMLYRLIVG